MQWTAVSCQETFENLARRLFYRNAAEALSLTTIVRVISSFVKDSKYDSRTVESAFHATFGGDIPMFSPLSNSVKLGVTTSSARSSTLHILSNYWGRQHVYPSDLTERPVTVMDA